MRRTRGWMIAGGSIEMMKNRIAEEALGPALLATRNGAIRL